MTSCRPRRNSFRLLDCWTGWDVDEHDGVVGFQDRSGLRLAPRVGFPGAVHLADLRHCLLPAQVAWDPAGRLFVAAGNDLRVLDPCTGRRSDLVLPFEPVAISGLSWGGGLLAIAAIAADRIPPRARRLAALSLFDWMVVARAGAGQPVGALVRGFVEEEGGRLVPVEHREVIGAADLHGLDHRPG